MSITMSTITVTDNNGQITATPDPLVIQLGQAVTWDLAQGAQDCLYIQFTAEIFQRLQYVICPTGGFGVISTTLGRHSYTISSQDGKRKVDPIIIVDPIQGP